MLCALYADNALFQTPGNMDHLNALHDFVGLKVYLQ